VSYSLKRLIGFSATPEFFDPHAAEHVTGGRTAASGHGIPPVHSAAIMP
jgi:hypothetical protein